MLTREDFVFRCDNDLAQLAALRAGIRTVMLPERNRRDLEEIPADAREQLTIVWVQDVDQALATALEPAIAVD